MANKLICLIFAFLILLYFNTFKNEFRLQM